MDLTKLAQAHGDKPAYVLAGTGDQMTYDELESRSNQVAHLFHGLGLQVGDHIAVITENNLDLFPVVWAAQRSGLYYTLVNWHLTDEEAAYVVDNCEAKVLVTSVDRSSLGDFAVAGAPRVQARFVLGPQDVGTTPSLDSAVADLPATPLGHQVEGFYMFYSSGTTGRPKGIMPALSGEPFGTGLTLDRTMPSFGFGPSSRYLCPGPLYHAAPMGWSLGTVRNGGTVVVMETFEPEAALRAIAGHGITHAQFVPTMFVRLLKLPAEVHAAYDLSTLMLAVHAAAPCPVPVKEAMIDWLGPKLLEYYAGSESQCFFVISSQEWLTHKGSVGRAMIGVPRILDAFGQELPAGEIGQIWISDGPDFTYHGDEAKTAAAHNDRGWSTLGDIGHLDEEGYLYLSGRRTDLILSGGVNIYPAEVENVLVLHPAVADIAVIGVPDEEMGQRVHAVIRVAEGVTASPELARELADHVRTRIARFKAPRSVSFVEDFPRLPSGKVLKRQLMSDFTDDDSVVRTTSNR